ERDQRWPARRIDRLARPGFFSPQVHSVVSGVLTDQIDFAHAFRDQPANLRQHRVHPSAAMFPPHLRDNTETARVIATLGDFYVCRMRRCESKTRGVVIRNIRWPRLRE